jgi:hypothetical protein
MKKLIEVSDWVDQYRVFWTKKLDDLGNFLDAESKASRTRKKAKK